MENDKKKQDNALLIARRDEEREQLKIRIMLKLKNMMEKEIKLRGMDDVKVNINL